MIASGEKKEEYREVKKFWVSRLCDKHEGTMGGDIMDKHKVIAHTLKQFDTIVFKNGYQKNAPTITLKCDGLSIGKAKPEWSDNWEGEAFVIKLGEILERSPF